MFIVCTIKIHKFIYALVTRGDDMKLYADKYFSIFIRANLYSTKDMSPSKRKQRFNLILHRHIYIIHTILSYCFVIESVKYLSQSCVQLRFCAKTRKINYKHDEENFS